MAEILTENLGVILKLISSEEKLILDAVDGSQTICNSKKVFSFIDSDFEKYGLNIVSSATNEIFSDVYQVMKNATFKQMFSYLGGDFNKLCLTQHQILIFISKHKDWLSPHGTATFFPFECKENFFVARTHVYFDGLGNLSISVNRFNDGYPWPVNRPARIVVPRI